MNKTNLNKIEKYQLFCLENYKFAQKISGISALKEFEKYKVFSFISSGYEVLHTQSMEYAVKEIIDYIEKKK